MEVMGCGISGLRSLEESTRDLGRKGGSGSRAGLLERAWQEEARHSDREEREDRVLGSSDQQDGGKGRRWDAHQLRDVFVPHATPVAHDSRHVTAAYDTHHCCWTALAAAAAS